MNGWKIRSGIALAFLVSHQAAGQFAADGIAMYARLAPMEFGLKPDNFRDCWGFVSPQGREFVALAMSNGTAFVDVSDPLSPRIVAEAAYRSPGGARDVKIHGNLAYTSVEGGELQVIDISRLDQGQIEVVNTLPYGAHNLVIDEVDQVIYLCDHSQGIRRLRILDAGDPVNPTLISQWSQGVHDLLVVRYDEGPFAGRDIIICFSGPDGLLVYDATDKSDLQLLSQSDYPQMTFCHQGWIGEDGRYLYLNDDADELRRGTLQRTIVFDISDITNPLFVGEFGSGWPSTDHSLYVHEGFVYESNCKGGFHLFDVRSDPVNAEHVGYFDTFPPTDLPGRDGAWAAFPFLPSGIVVVSDHFGLFLLDASEARGERMTLSVDPLVVGQPAMLRVEDAQPGAQVYFGYSTTGIKWTRVPMLDVLVELANPRLAGFAAASTDGTATIEVTPPRGQGRVVWFQAAHAGRVSNVIEATIN